MPKRRGGVLLTCVLMVGVAVAGCSDSTEPEDGDLPLVGTTWTVESYDLGQGTTQPPEGLLATVLLREDGSAELDTGCNTADGRFDAGAGTVSFSVMSMTEVGCEGAAAELEQSLRRFYEHDQLTWAVAGDLLILEPPESVSQDWVDLRGTPVEDAD